MRNLTDSAAPDASIAEVRLEVHSLSQQLMSCHETERAHIARELHDDVQQILYGLSLNMVPSARLPQQPPSLEEVAQWRQLVEEAMGHLRALTLKLRPAVLESQGLIPELRHHIDRLRAGTSAHIHLNVGANFKRLSPATELTCYRIIQEALTNSLKHAKASLVIVSLACTAHSVTITISDDGSGFDVAKATARAQRSGNIGLMSMRERAAIIGGDLEIRSAPGSGAMIIASIPMGTNDITSFS